MCVLHLIDSVAVSVLHFGDYVCTRAAESQMLDHSDFDSKLKMLTLTPTPTSFRLRS